MAFLLERKSNAMCGRLVITDYKADIRDAFSVDEVFEGEVKPLWNVAPMQGIGFVSEQLYEGELVRRLEIARWGAGARVVEGPQSCRREDDQRPQ